ncbi:hypothetical protein B0A55_01365 [Friedmanniomyces simplex]|uniref:F-box domain-containing protein n=1 Tax=Friedmanniomyces simplex TaxID=329884 RepID=A0A4U0Y4Y6_9PEZI|nr:hypothetical protein B0A55_01365 [Friedmanniomyces simplex]
MAPKLLTSTEYSHELTRSVAEQYNLKYDIKYGLNLLRLGLAEEAAEFLERTRRMVERLGGLQRASLAPIYFNRCIKPGSFATSARKTFGIPEMLELILSKLEPIDLLRVQQVNRTMRDAVNGSTTLLQKLFLLPDRTALLEILFLGTYTNSSKTNLITVACQRPLGSVQDTECLISSIKHRHVRANFVPPLPRLGLRIRRLLICQPPVYEMAMQVHCCTAEHRAAMGARPIQAHEYVVNPAGLTLGNLYDEAACALGQHENCPFASPDRHAADGTVRRHVRFQTLIELPRDHPQVVEDMAAKEREARGRDSANRFCEAKKRGESLLSNM